MVMNEHFANSFHAFLLVLCLLSKPFLVISVCFLEENKLLVGYLVELDEDVLTLDECVKRCLDNIMCRSGMYHTTDGMCIMNALTKDQAPTRYMHSFDTDGIYFHGDCRRHRPDLVKQAVTTITTSLPTTVVDSGNFRATTFLQSSSEHPPEDPFGFDTSFNGGDRVNSCTDQLTPKVCARVMLNGLCDRIDGVGVRFCRGTCSSC